MENRKVIIKDIALTAIFIALIAVSAQITVPLPSGVPVTMQTLAVALCGYCLDMKKSISAVLTYLIMGLVGLPVFAGFVSGPAILFGKTGGFIIGFIFLAFACAIAVSVKNRILKIVIGVIGLLLCHAIGVIWFAFITKMNVWAATVMVSLPFLVKDIICVAIASLVSGRMRKVIEKQGK